MLGNIRGLESLEPCAAQAEADSIGTAILTIISLLSLVVFAYPRVVDRTLHPLRDFEIVNAVWIPMHGIRKEGHKAR